MLQVLGSCEGESGRMHAAKEYQRSSSAYVLKQWPVGNPETSGSS
jgi:hypothetical protein